MRRVIVIGVLALAACQPVKPQPLPPPDTSTLYEPCGDQRPDLDPVSGRCVHYERAVRDENGAITHYRPVIGPWIGFAPGDRFIGDGTP